MLFPSTPRDSAILIHCPPSPLVIQTVNLMVFFNSFYSSLGHISGQSPHLVLSISEFPVISVLSFFSTFCVLVAASVNCWLSPYVSRVDSLQEKIWLVWLIFCVSPLSCALESSYLIGCWQIAIMQSTLLGSVKQAEGRT